MLHTKIIDLKKEKIDIKKAEIFISSSKFGASIIFKGTVRNTNGNKQVTGITYDSHDTMVIKSFKEIYNEIEKKFNVADKSVFIEHVKGYVGLGEISIIIAVACPHRSEAYELSRFMGDYGPGHGWYGGVPLFTAGWEYHYPGLASPGDIGSWEPSADWVDGVHYCDFLLDNNMCGTGFSDNYYIQNTEDIIEFTLHNIGWEDQEFIFSIYNTQNEEIYNNLLTADAYSEANIQIDTSIITITNNEEYKLKISPTSKPDSYQEIYFYIEGILGDFNNDSIVNIIDIIIMVNSILANEYNALYDLNNDQLNNILDIIRLMNIILD